MYIHIMYAYNIMYMYIYMLYIYIYYTYTYIYIIHIYNTISLGITILSPHCIPMLTPKKNRLKSRFLQKRRTSPLGRSIVSYPPPGRSARCVALRTSCAPEEPPKKQLGLGNWWVSCRKRRIKCGI